MQATAIIAPILRAYSSTTLRGAIADFLTYAEIERGWSPQTRAAYSGDLHLFDHWVSQRLGPSAPLSQVLTPEAYSAFTVSFARDHRVGAARRWRLLASGRSFLHFAERKGLIPPCNLDLLERPKLPHRLPAHLDLPQAQALSAATASLTPRDRAIVLTLLHTGIRVGELTGLNLNDLGATTLRVRGKGDRERIVPLPPTARAAITAYLPTREEKHHPALFTSRQGRISIRTVQRLVSRAASLADGPGAHPHKLRHTYATLLHQAGADILDISRILGHASVATTQIYAASDPAQLQSAAALFPSLSLPAPDAGSPPTPADPPLAPALPSKTTLTTETHPAILPQ